MTRFALAIFDLDGVLADSARLHFIAWKRIADELGIAFDEADNEALKGIDRMGSLRAILALGGRTMSEQSMLRLAEAKNAFYLAGVATMGPADLLPGAIDLIEAANAAGMACAVASASRNAPLVLERLGIAQRFDHVADAAALRPKPAPDLFLDCAAALGIAPAHAIGFEDSAAGITAIKAAGMVAVGIGDPDILVGADIVFPTTAAVDLRAVMSRGR